MPEAVIVDAVRSPIGRAFKGSLIDVRPDDLGARVVDALLERNPGVDPATVEDLICGCGLPQGEQAFNLGRIVVLLSEQLPDTVTATTVNRYCASSLQAIRSAFHAIEAGEGETFIAAGIECVSRVGPQSEFTLPESRNERLSGGNGRPNAYIDMGQTAENVANLEKVSREEQDEFAALSQQRATASLENGFWEGEITPIETVDAEGKPVTVKQDDGIRAGTTVEKLAQLQPAFKPDGTVTAGNACPLNDGAAAVIVMSDTKAKELGITPLARIVSSGVTGLNPEIMGLGPVEAIKQALGRAGKTLADIDLFEINEAFAAQVVPSARDLDISYDKLNVNGGGIAVGHPFGMTGARIMTTLIHGLQDRDGTFGVESMCVGGGQGMAMVLERV